MVNSPCVRHGNSVTDCIDRSSDRLDLIVGVSGPLKCCSVLNLRHCESCCWYCCCRRKIQVKSGKLELILPYLLTQAQTGKHRHKFYGKSSTTGPSTTIYSIIASTQEHGVTPLHELLSEGFFIIDSVLYHLFHNLCFLRCATFKEIYLRDV